MKLTDLLTSIELVCDAADHVITTIGEMDAADVKKLCDAAHAYTVAESDYNEACKRYEDLQAQLRQAQADLFAASDRKLDASQALQSTGRVFFDKLGQVAVAHAAAKQAAAASPFSSSEVPRTFAEAIRQHEQAMFARAQSTCPSL